jgi:hypothetical protein
MNIIEAIININYWSILVAGLSTLFLGNLWYSPILFGRKWMELTGFTPEEIRDTSNIPVILSSSFITSILSAFALAMFLGPESNALFGMFAGFMIAVFWITTSKLNNVLFEKQKTGLFLIHAGYDIVSYLIMGAIIGAWH